MGVLDTYEETRKKAGTTGCCIGAMVGLSVPVSMIIMGAMYKDDCPAQHYIPIYLIVSGTFSSIVTLLRLLQGWMAERYLMGSPNICDVITGIISLFLFAWFITGNVWIYGLNNKYSTEPTDPNFCNHTFYLYAFWVTTGAYIFMGLIILLCCCCYCRK